MNSTIKHIQPHLKLKQGFLIIIFFIFYFYYYYYYSTTPFYFNILTLHDAVDILYLCIYLSETKQKIILSLRVEGFSYFLINLC